MSAHQVHIWPWLRPVGRLMLADWLAITIGRHIFAWRPMTDRELAHELAHVRQWQSHGLAFPIVYALASLQARRAGRRWYHDNRFEAEAREAASRPAPR